MSQWFPVGRFSSYDVPPDPKTAMVHKDTKMALPIGTASNETETLIRTLTFQVPDVEFSVEVDILGRHRVTIHFKGADISIDNG